jgi:predicted MFS family arabinose efflux permease
LDRRGIVVTFLLLAALVLGITRVIDELTGRVLWPWLLGAVFVLLVLLIVVESRAAQALIPLSLFANPQLATTYGLALGAGFGMGSVIFVSSIATSAYGVTANRVGFVLLPLVVCSMLGSAGSGRLLNRMGARGLLLAGFALLGVGYATLSVTKFGLREFYGASIPVGLGLGIVVGGALRSIAIDEAPANLRAAAQGLINICNAIGTLLSAAAIGAIADLTGGGVPGFAAAYRTVALVMVVTLLAAFRLERHSAAPAH